MSEIENILLEFWHIAIVAFLLLLISVGFVHRFIFPAWGLNRELKTAIAALKSIRSELDGNIVELDEIQSKAMVGPTLAHLWTECRFSRRTDPGFSLRSDPPFYVPWVSFKSRHSLSPSGF